MSRRVLSLSEAGDEIDSRLSKRMMSSRTVLSGMSLVGDESSMGPSYQDPAYFPYYFHLGRVLRPSRMLCVGFDLGLQAGCVLQGCDSPDSMFAIQPSPSHHYSARIAVSNVKRAGGRGFPLSVYVGGIEDDSFPGIAPSSFDLAFVTCFMPPDPMMNHLHFCWQSLSEGGFLSVDRLSESSSEDIFKDFCKARNVDFRLFPTRYRSGIVRK
jgi:hypothetical protein